MTNTNFSSCLHLTILSGENVENLDVYENTIDPVEQIELAQYMTTLMSIRPRFELEASYFINSYNSHIASLKAHKSFLAGIIQF